MKGLKNSFHWEHSGRHEGSGEIVALFFMMFFAFTLTGCEQGLNSAGNRIFANGIPQKNPTPFLQVPGALSSTVLSTTSIALSWSDDSTAESGYEVQYCVGSGCIAFVSASGSPLAVNSHGYTATGLAPATTYRFRVRALQGSSGTSWASTGDVATPAVVVIPAPPSLTTSSATDTTVTLNWNDLSNNELGFEILYNCNSSLTVCGSTATVGAGVTTYTATGLTDNLVQYLGVRSYNAAGNSVQVGTAVVTLPSAPAFAAATNISGRSMTLNWADNSTNESQFQIERCVGAACTDYSLYALAAPNATSLAISVLTYGVTYGFRIRAVGLANSTWSTLSVTTSSYFTAPASMAAVAVSSTGVTLTWAGNVAGETGYEVDYCAGSSCSNFAGTSTVLGHTLSQTVTGLIAASTYTFRVRAYDSSSGATVYSAPLLGVQTTMSLPSTPQNVRVKGLTSTKVAITWDDLATDETTYEVSRCADSACDSNTYTVVSNALAANSTRYIFTGLSSSSTYKLRVRALRTPNPDYSAAAYSALTTPNNESQAWIPNGSVLAQYRYGNKLYLGGNFTSIAPPASYAGMLTASAGSWSPSVLTNRLQNPLDGNVQSLAPDGTGGFYVGGTFAEGVHHILSDGSLDTGFNVTTNGSVNSLYLSGTTLYLGGLFTTLTQGGVGTTRNNLAALNIAGASPVIAAFNPNLNGDVGAISVSGSTVFFGGSFTTVAGGSSCARLAAYSSAGAHIATWCPAPDAAVASLKVSGGTLYVGGSFLNINSVGQSYLASFNTTTAAVTASAVALPSPNAAVDSIDVSGTTVFIAGAFTSVGASLRSYLASLDGLTGSLNSFNLSINGRVKSLAVGSSNIYLGGLFTSVAGTSRQYVAAVTTAGVLVSGINPMAASTVYCVGIDNSNDRVFLGGDFSWIGGYARNYLASIDVTTGIPTTWDPQPNGAVRAITGNASYVYFGGDFTTVRSTSQPYFAAIDPLAHSSFVPFYTGLNGAVRALTLYNGLVYAGGSFTAVGTTTRQRLAAFDENTFSLSSWDPTAGTDPLGDVFALATDTMSVAGSVSTVIFAGGGFSNIGGVSRNFLAAITSSGTLVTTYDAGLDSVVYALSVDHVGRNLFVAGNFTAALGGMSKYLAGIVINENPTLIVGSSDPNLTATAYAVNITLDGTAVLVGGAFDSAWGGARQSAASLDSALSSTLNAWNPNHNMGDVVQTIDPSIDNIYIGGAITGFNTASHPYFGLTLLTDGSLLSW